VETTVDEEDSDPEDTCEEPPTKKMCKDNQISQLGIWRSN